MNRPANLNPIISVLVAAVCSIGATGETQTTGPSTEPLPELRLSLREAMEAAVDNNPNVRLFRERVETARATSKTQFGALLPNFSTTVRQTNQTFFLGTVRLAPVRTIRSVFSTPAPMSRSRFSFAV